MVFNMLSRTWTISSQKFNSLIFNYARKYSSASSQFLVWEKLVNRSLIRVGGSDSSEFLQGLVTNDITILDHESHHGSNNKAMYSMMLNRQGRVLYDLIIYSKKLENDHEYIVECSREKSGDLLRAFKFYKLRKKVSLNMISDSEVWAVISKEKLDFKNFRYDEDSKLIDSEYILCSKEVEKSDIILHEVKQVLEPTSNIYPDPRLTELGCRVITEPSQDLSTELKSKGYGDLNTFPYTKFRYQLGIPEGINDLLPEKALPLESNLDFLNGVNFHKGCYIGQELTARTHHTGVIRKRLMPFSFSDSNNHVPEVGSIIENENGKNVGKFISVLDSHGFALMRINEARKSKLLKIVPYGIEIQINIPYWWSQEMKDLK